MGKKQNTGKKDFAFGYYNTNAEGIINAGPYLGLTVKDAKELNAAQRNEASKKYTYEEGERVAEETRKGINKAGKVLQTVIKVVDPTGVTSWGDVKDSFNREGISWNTALETAGALPMVGKLGKLAKLGKLSKAPKVIAKPIQALHELEEAKKVLSTVKPSNTVRVGARTLKKSFDTASPIHSAQEIKRAREIVNKYKNVDRVVLGTRLAGDAGDISDTYKTLTDLKNENTEDMKPKLKNGINTQDPRRDITVQTENTLESKVDWTENDRKLKEERQSKLALLKNSDKLKTMSVKEIQELRASYGELSTEDFDEISKGLSEKGYPYRAIARPTESGGNEIEFQRKVLGLSSDYKNMLNEGKGGWQRGINYEDGGWEPLSEQQYEERKSKYTDTKNSDMWESISDTSDAYKKKPTLPELKKGLDFSSTSNYKKWLAYGHASGEFEKTPGNQSISIKGERKKVKHLPKLEGGIDAGTGISQGGALAADIVKRFDTQEEGQESVAGSALSGAATGAGIGFAVGGPVGAAIGGGVMGAAGAISTIMSNKKAKKEKERRKLEMERKEALSHFKPAQNTQANMYEFGTSGANMTKPVEVEKDEVVLRKDALGKFKLKADFKGGNSHKNGGEDYVLEQGDIVFPGKKRTTIMKSLKSGNHARIESERLKLPKDLPNTDKLEPGIDYLNQILPTNEPKVPSWLQNPTFQTKSYGEEIHVPKDVPLVGSQTTQSELKSTTKDSTKQGTDWGSLLNYVPAISNMIKGTQTPEKVERDYIKPETLKYKDSSETLRKEARLQSEIDKENAVRFSGGSAQVARAGKAIAGVNRFRRLQGVDAQEQQRADALNAANVSIRNQAKGTNIELKNRYEELDAMNKAAVDAYFDQGVSDFSRITSQMRRDKALSKMQDVALSNLETDNYMYDKTTGKRRFKRKGE